MNAERTVQPASLPESVRTTLESLRGRIRLYVWLHGLAVAICWLGVAFWASLIIDWFFEPVREIRALALVGVAIAVGGVILKLVIGRLRVPLADSSMALLLERRFPELGDSLLTAVELAGHPAEDEGFSEAMLEHTSHDADQRIGLVRVGAVFDPVPLRRGLMGAAGMILSISLFAVMVHGGFSIWAKRCLMLSQELWPRQTRLEVAGFPNGVAKVARGSDLEVIALADTSKPVTPNTVEVRYRTEGGSRGRRPMNREGEADPKKDPFQRYSYTFQGVLAPITFDLVGGDDRIRNLRIEVVESPTLEAMALRCVYPEYMARPERRLPVIGVMQVPVGTEVIFEGVANKDLLSVRIDSVLEEVSSAPVEIELAPDQPRRFAHDLTTVDRDTTLMFSLLDTDNIRNREPLRVAISAVADEAPELPIEMHGIGTAITPQAQLPMVGRVTDDYGVARVWFEHKIDQATPGEANLTSPEGNVTDIPIETALDVRDLKLTPGQKLQVCMKAADRYDLGKEPNVGSSQKWVLEVVTPERLRLILQARELVLRERFEAILREVTDTRETLMRIDYAAPEKPAAEGKTEENKKAKEKGDNPKKANWEGAEPGDEPGDAPTDRAASDPERLAGLRSLRCERTIQNCRKNAEETLGTSVAFDEIRLQLINNRIDSEEAKIRLGSGIAEPLRHIAEKMFPELEQRLLALRAQLDDPVAGPRNREFARQQIDAILLNMKQVLERMRAQEDYNELIEWMQKIIDEQEELAKQTKKRQDAQLHDLLED
ncbi:MAG: hypothetical protein JW818_12830 [Pirellulales bacterium]|nr:hypothetical protein [Pirellulales bacterium]